MFFKEEVEFESYFGTTVNNEKGEKELFLPTYYVYICLYI
jgi:hypothetical protein